MAQKVGGSPLDAPAPVRDRALDLLITGQGLLIDQGSPFKDGKLGTLQMFLLKRENFVQSASAPDEPVAVAPTEGEPALEDMPGDTPREKLEERERRRVARVRGGTSGLLEALRTHYKVKPFRLTLEGLLMPGETLGESRSMTVLPTQKVNTILQFIQDAHLLAYASDTTQQGIGTGFIKNLVITNFDWDRVEGSGNYLKFSLEMQMVTQVTGGDGGPQVGPEDGGEKPPE